MDLEKYIKKGKGVLPTRIRKCLSCGRKLENNGTYLYRISFCSEECKDTYMNRGKEY